ncbi:exopolysaccharide biosynthesis polyprenyl glycosylphosphotransferase [Humitalea rosea]|nr:exopolysaccharide biosynthesis polyprenyl glycosylphosphotransferase [Humitalea rosea]
MATAPRRSGGINPRLAGVLLGLTEALAMAAAGIVLARLQHPADFSALAFAACGLVPMHLVLCGLLGGFADLPMDRRTGRGLRSVVGSVVALAVFTVPMPLQTSHWGLLVWVAATGATSGTLLVLLRRGASRPALRDLVRRPVRPAALIGDSQAAVEMLPILERGGFAVTGFYDDRFTRPGPLGQYLPRLGSVADLIASAEHEDLSDVFLALPWTAGGRIADLCARLRFLPITLRLIPDQPPPLATDRADSPEPFIPVLLRPPLSTTMLALKDIFDRIGAAILLTLFLPVLVIVPILIRLDTPGPVFFRQNRIGRFGERFRIFKYRTLRVEEADAEASVQVDRGDHRVTRVGWFLRKYSLDELPQLFNVLRGEMSLVGPRPHAPGTTTEGRIFSEVVPEYPLRYRVKPGLTGLAQVNGWRGRTDTVDKLRRRVDDDFSYIREWSLMSDLIILLRTLPAVLYPPRDNL